MLQRSELFDFLRPGLSDVADFPRGDCDGAGNQILVCVDQLVILETEKNEVINIFFDEFGALLILNLTTTILVTCIKNSLSHEDFDYIKESWVAIQIKSNFI